MQRLYFIFYGPIPTLCYFFFNFSCYRYPININAISQTQRLYFISFFKEIISNDVYIASYHTNYISFKCPTE